MSASHNEAVGKLVNVQADARKVHHALRRRATADKSFAEAARDIASAVANHFAAGGQGLANFLLHSLNMPLIQTTHRAITTHDRNSPTLPEHIESSFVKRMIVAYHVE